MAPFTAFRVTTPSQGLVVSAPVSVVAVVSVIAVSIAPTGAVSELMPGVPVSVPAPPAPASRLPLLQAAKVNAIVAPRIQDERFMGSPFPRRSRERSPLGLNW